MAGEFENAVENGIKLSKRLYYGNDRSVSPPKRPAMERSSDSYLPTAPMVYAVIFDPAIVDNPDIPSYQPHVHGRYDQPALIPLQMNDISLEADCFLDNAVVTVSGSWRVHCVMACRSCDCCIAIPMGKQGSVLGIEVDIPTRSYYTQFVAMGDNGSTQKVDWLDGKSVLKYHAYTFIIPEVNGGSNLSIKVSWSQKLSYHATELLLEIPFDFPEYVTPAGKRISKKERIQLKVDSSSGTETLCGSSSHPLKELKRKDGKLVYLYESEVFAWSKTNFLFSYTISSSHIYGGILLQSPSVHEFDQREKFCLYFLPGNQPDIKTFKKQVVFLVDISKSMRGRPIEDIKKVLSSTLLGFDPFDLFNIIVFNEESYSYSSCMESATKEAIENAIHWINMNFVPGGGTNIVVPLNEALKLLSYIPSSIPIIFLITDGAVEDEKTIIDAVRSCLRDQRSHCPRLYTFGIGSFCNHYFLQMLATITKGQYSAAYIEDSIEHRLQELLTKAFSGIVANISIDNLDDLDELEVYPSCIPDLLSESPLIVSGRYRGDFPCSLKAKGVFADSSNFMVDMNVQNVPTIVDKIIARQQVDLITAEAWFSESKQLEDKATKISTEVGVISEYTHMILLETDRGRKGKATRAHEGKKTSGEDGEQRRVAVRNMGIGFGNISATIENTPPGCEQQAVTSDGAEIIARAASMCGDLCCCMHCINACSGINSEFGIVVAQLCTGLACFGCIECCSNVCCDQQHD